MVKRVSALQSGYELGADGILGVDGQAGVVLQEIINLQLYQLAAWPDTIVDVASHAADELGLDTMPDAGQAVVRDEVAVLRVEPLKWWVFGSVAPSLSAEQGSNLDISHSRVHIRITGAAATTLLNTQLPLDLRADAFPLNSVASTAIHHVGVTLWHSEQGYELFIPRGFSLSLWQGIVESAKQFGLRVLPHDKND